MANTYRRFWFTNAKGETKLLSSEEITKVFLDSPSNLGYQNSVQAVRLGNGAKLLHTSRSFPNPTGELIFYADTITGVYNDYNNFIKFISVGGLQFHYSPATTSAIDYFIDCEIASVDKGQIDHSNGAMHCSINITGLSFWKDANLVNSINKNEVVNSGKYYNLVRDYHYEGSSLNDIEIINNGTEEIGFIIEIDPQNPASPETTNTVTNPTWALYHEDEIVSYGIAQMTGTFDKVIVSSLDGYQNITLIQNGATVPNPATYQKLDFNNQGIVTFPRLKVGKSHLVFSCSSLETYAGSVNIRFNHSYASV